MQSIIFWFKFQSPLIKLLVDPEFLMTLNEQQTSLPNGERLTLRAVTAEDEALLLFIYDSSRAEELAQGQWQEGQREAFVKWQFDLQRREYDARFPDAEYAVILVDDQPAGRIWIGRDAEEIHLLDIVVLPEFQNRGVGGALLSSLIDEAKQRSKALRHYVFVMNTDALRFYERLGFVVIEEIGAYKHMEWKSEPPAVAGGPSQNRLR
ncbi:MAG TPA: GNAT family N-acetyltransferase [Blastocatellia bacterium]|nr:GNAT family N-acetyltransferase [Blastocatellia bacterium]